MTINVQSITVTALLVLTHYTLARSTGDARELLKILGTKGDGSEFETTLREENKPSSSLSSSDWVDDKDSDDIENAQWAFPHHPAYFRFGDQDVVSADEGDSKYPGESARDAIYLALQQGDGERYSTKSQLEKRFRPSGFMGSRGKRYIPGLESLLLARYYQDAEKWKRQPHYGFHGTRG